MLTLHHLGQSQSERILWLLEELGIDYALERHERRADTRMAPPSYRALHPLGTAPVLCDGELALGESAAICDYVIQVYGSGRCAVKAGQPGFADYVYWFHFANGTLQPSIFRLWSLERADPDDAHGLVRSAQARFELVLTTLDARLKAAAYLAGSELTAADIMTVFSLTTMRLFKPYDLGPWPHIVAYLTRIGARPAYQRAMRKAEPGFTPLLRARP